MNRLPVLLHAFRQPGVLDRSYQGPLGAATGVIRVDIAQDVLVEEPQGQNFTLLYCVASDPVCRLGCRHPVFVDVGDHVVGDEGCIFVGRGAAVLLEPLLLVDALGARIRALGPDLVSEVRFRTDEDRAFFDAHGALYADT